VTLALLLLLLLMSEIAVVGLLVAHPHPPASAPPVP
jgi:hypothetical protein